MKSKALYLKIVSLSLWKVGNSATFTLHEVYFAEKDGKLRKWRTLFFFNMHVHVSQTDAPTWLSSLIFTVNLYDSRPQMNFVNSFIMQLPLFLFMFISQWKTRRGCSQQLGGCNKWDIVSFYKHNITYPTQMITCLWK